MSSKKKIFFVYEKLELLLETNIKKKIEGGFTFMRRIYHASHKKHNLNSIPSFEFQNMQFYDKENFKKKLYLIKIQFSFEF